ncbi:nuclear transport factor 2 family protein [Prescottella equi]|uniref:nuclear transport factor 2 family protein n=1 Tax=Rhodococcus hoagii TaxID=43767 RepID=UPI0009BE92FE|nr:nuclear transport factor 2 family protein [Prescottella equi]OQQ37504.1 gamma-BHC dehydrochlorinase [Prescottella equi]WQB73284.1 nuclear transport factor 2 family protein [Prescottella equi]
MSLIDKQEITEVLYRYARAVDRKDFDRVADCYFPDAIDNHGGYIGTVAGLIEDMRSRHATIDSSLHYVTNVLIDLDGDTADVESYCLCYLRQAPAVAGGPQSRATVKCRYVDRFERRDGQWRIADRIVVFDESVTDEIVDALSPSWVRSRRSFEDPVFTGKP